MVEANRQFAQSRLARPASSPARSVATVVDDLNDGSALSSATATATTTTLAGTAVAAATPTLSNPAKSGGGWRLAKVAKIAAIAKRMVDHAKEKAETVRKAKSVGGGDKQAAASVTNGDASDAAAHVMQHRTDHVQEAFERHISVIVEQEEVPKVGSEQ